MRSSKFLTLFAVFGLMLGTAGCDDLLDVSDPERFTDEDLDGALEAVANGAEGALLDQIDEMTYFDALNSDLFQHTGTWNGWDEIDHGRWVYGLPSTDGDYNSLLQARWFAQDAADRFIRVLGEAEANSTVMMAQVKTVEAYADLYLGQFFCEAPLGPNGAAFSDTEVLQQAVQSFTDAVAQARAVNSDLYEHASLMGRARANLLLGNYAAAASDAAAVPDGAEYLAIYTESQQNNSLVNLATAGFNRAAGMRVKWWDQEVPMPGASNPNLFAIQDPWTGEADPRMPILTDGTQGVDGVTDHHSQWRYTTRGADIVISDSDEMRLIQAEAAWRAGDLDEAQTILNGLRAAVGLSPLPETDSADRVREYVMSERLAEGFMAYQMRSADLRRFDMYVPLLQAGDFIGSENPRPVKFTMSDSEARDNTNIEDLAAQRCYPTVSF